MEKGVTNIRSSIIRMAEPSDIDAHTVLSRRLFSSLTLSIGALMSLFSGACTEKPQRSKKITLELVDRGWFNREFRDLRDRQYKDFSAKTGIDVQLLPGPEDALEQVKLWRELLGRGPDALKVHPDVFGIDVIWPGLLGDDLLDLKPFVGEDIAAYFPELISNFVVNGRLVALPHRLDIGLLYYRTDLLQRHGYHAAPETWDDLETMAAHIQNGERRRGNNGFWGFVWQGAVSEALTCNALEWQASEGGGRIIERDGRVSVNNAQAIKSWERAARWVGTISPPGITRYKEQDASNLWLSGQVAFMRHWTAAYIVSESETSAVKSRFGVSLLPKGTAGRAEVFGGDGYSVSRLSAHPKESIDLLRYLCSREEERIEAQVLSTPPTVPALYRDADLLEKNKHFGAIGQTVLEGMVARPSTVAGKRYLDVSLAYSQAVHSVLEREQRAAVAASKLEDQLRDIMRSN